MPGRSWREVGSRLAVAAVREGRQGRAIPFDREHCDGCHRILARGSLRNVRVAGDGNRVDDWEARCSECIRKGSPRPVGPGTEGDPLPEIEP